MKKHHTVSLTLLALVLSVGLFSLYRNIGGGQLAERRHHDHTSVCRWCFFQRKGQLGRTI